jgi:glutaredoxin 3
MDYYKIICWSECPFCLRAKTLLLDKGVQFEYCSIDHSRKLLDYYKLVYKQDTVPMIIKLNTEDENEQFIGGYTELKKLFEGT